MGTKGQGGGGELHPRVADCGSVGTHSSQASGVGLLAAWPELESELGVTSDRLEELFCKLGLEKAGLLEGKAAGDLTDCAPHPG